VFIDRVILLFLLLCGFPANVSFEGLFFPRVLHVPLLWST